MCSYILVTFHFLLCIFFVDKTEASLRVDPVLKSITGYKVGDLFTHNCTSVNSTNFTYVWSMLRCHNGTNPAGIQLDSAKSSVFLNITLDESFNNTKIQCTEERRNPINDFEDFDSVSTTLLLVQSIPKPYEQNLLVWFIVPPLLGVVIVSLAIYLFCRRNRTRDSEEIVEVENDLYNQSNLIDANLIGKDYTQ